MTSRLWKYGFATLVAFVAWTTLAQADVLKLIPASELGSTQQIDFSQDAMTCVSEDSRQERFNASSIEADIESNLEAILENYVDLKEFSVVAGGDNASEDKAEASEGAPSPSPLQVVLMEGTGPGDVNHDGYVDQLDAIIIASNWQYGVHGTGDADWDMGDLNGDGKIDGSDATLLAFYWGAVYVPEPATILLLLSGVVAFVVSRRLRRA